jgi:O-antigen ligase
LIKSGTSLLGKQLSRKLLFVNAFFITVGSTLLFLYSNNFERMFQRLEILSSAGGGESASERIGMINSVFDALNNISVPLFGLGVGGFSVHYAHFDDIRGFYPHNILLEVLVEMGLPALISVVAWIAYAIRRLYKSQNDENLLTTTLLFSLLVFNFFNALVSGDLNDNRLLYFSIGTIFVQSSRPFSI